MGCFVRGGKNGMGCFVRGDKNCMRCFVRGGKLMRGVLSGVAKNGMGCFVPGCFVLHSSVDVCTPTLLHAKISLHTAHAVLSAPLFLEQNIEHFVGPDLG